MPRFLFATGIEGSYPVISDGRGGTIRQDQMEASDHYRRWREDFDLVAGLGRRPPPLGAADPPDLARARAGTTGRSATTPWPTWRELGIEPILDLCHFGMPDWLGNSFQNPEFAAGVRRLRRRLRPALSAGSGSTRRSTRSTSAPASAPSWAGGTSG